MPRDKVFTAERRLLQVHLDKDLYGAVDAKARQRFLSKRTVVDALLRAWVNGDIEMDTMGGKREKKAGKAKKR